MATVKKCDYCGKEFDYGFLITVNLQGGQSFTNVADDRFEIGNKDLCKGCYYEIKEIVAKNKVRSD